MAEPVNVTITCPQGAAMWLVVILVAAWLFGLALLIVETWDRFELEQRKTKTQHKQ